MEIRPLREDDDRSAFCCGNADLDRFLRQFAGQNQFRHFVGVTYVAMEGRTLLGYVTVAPGEIAIDELPATTRSRLPRYPLPVLRLARLATHQDAHGRGIGARLLQHALTLSVRMAAEVGCVGVVVDAKPEAVGFYTRYGFEPIGAVAGASDARPQPVLLFLAMRAIREAGSSGG